MNALSPAWGTLWAEARTVDILEVAQRLGAKLKRSGPDFTGPCPAGCATSDGFIVTPGKHLFLCRPSGATGDAVDMVAHAQGWSKAEALEFVTGRDLPSRREETDEERNSREASQRAHAQAAEARRAEQEAREARKRRRDEEAVADVLQRAIPIVGTPAERYLAGRGLTPARRFTSDLRFVGDLDYWGVGADEADDLVHLSTLPAMVALIRDAAGEIIGIHQTFIDPVTNEKWRPIGSKRNAAKKIRGQSQGGMIRLGMVGDVLAIGEGIESTLGWYAQGFGPEDVSIACGVSLGNISGGAMGSLPHPTQKNAKGQPTRYRNGIPDPSKPGLILPADVRELILLGDSDSEAYATEGSIKTGAARFRSQGKTVAIHWAPKGMDWADVNKRQRAQMESSK